MRAMLLVPLARYICVPMTYGCLGSLTMISVKVAHVVVSWMLRWWSILSGCDKMPVLMLAALSFSTYDRSSVSPRR